MTNPPRLKIVLNLEQRHSDVFRNLVTLAACVCSSGQREDEYRRTAAKFTPEELSGLCEAFGDLPLEARRPLPGPLQRGLHGPPEPARAAAPGRCLHAQPRGPADNEAGDAPAGARGDAEGGGTGPRSGALVLAAAQALEELGVSRLHLQVVATDLNPFAVDMALANLGLAGIPAVVRHGNSLTG
ncbi:hypothetical protein [Deinococcus sp. DB0503]|uniref:hypothetical protein n=1 Tax=Deinococcus sp. DB0503 TaxID=2479203 RepID=UPI0018E004B1|nr:hypothetical protein [Deinococcus sp. DB0503]MBI0446887.1 hypothetical protein [Deinococcus sp. DB0503]